MKLVHQTIVFFLSLWLLFILAYYGVVFWNKMSGQKIISSFLSSVQAQQYEQAAEFWDGKAGSDFAGIMQKLNEEDRFRLLYYDHVSAEYGDGCVCTGHAELTFENNGKPLPVRAIVTFSPGNKLSQVCALTPSGVERGSISGLTEWNRMFCGGSSF